MLARAFEQDPIARYVFPDDAVRIHRLVPVYRLYLRVFARRGRVFSNEARSAAALWLPPGQYPLTWAQHLRLLPRMVWATGATGFVAATLTFFPDTGVLRITDASGRRIRETRWCESWRNLVTTFRELAHG